MTSGPAVCCVDDPDEARYAPSVARSLAAVAAKTPCRCVIVPSMAMPQSPP